MVAYSFKKQFVEPIRAGTKCQTIRAHRKRHAYPGEALQLYVGMRTKHCKKIIPDPQCTEVVPISLEVRAGGFGSVKLDGEILLRAERNDLAIADGFPDDGWGPPELQMWAFWVQTHGIGEFNGVVIRWRPG